MSGLSEERTGLYSVRSSWHHLDNACGAQAGVKLCCLSVMRCRQIYSARETGRQDQRLIGALRGRSRTRIIQVHRRRAVGCLSRRSSTCRIRVNVFFVDRPLQSRGLNQAVCWRSWGRGLLIVPDTGANGAQAYWHILKDSHQPPYTDKRDWPIEGRCLNKLLQDIVVKAFFSNFLLFALRC